MSRPDWIHSDEPGLKAYRAPAQIYGQLAAIDHDHPMFSISLGNLDAKGGWKPLKYCTRGDPGLALAWDRISPPILSRDGVRVGRALPPKGFYWYTYDQTTPEGEFKVHHRLVKQDEDPYDDFTLGVLLSAQSQDVKPVLWMNEKGQRYLEGVDH